MCTQDTFVNLCIYLFFMRKLFSNPAFVRILVIFFSQNRQFMINCNHSTHEICSKIRHRTHSLTDFAYISRADNARRRNRLPDADDFSCVHEEDERGSLMKLCKKVLITVGREYGSGGKSIADKLSHDLNIPIFDKNMLSIIAQKHGYSEDALASSDERLGNPFFEPYPSFGMDTGSISDKLYIMQSEIIREEANKGSAIFIGRCANDILEKYDDVVNIFIYAPKMTRIQRIMEVEDISDSTAAEKILRRTDKARRSYYQFYTDKKWGSSEGMDLLINSASLGIDGSVRLIEDYLRLRGYLDN